MLDNALLMDARLHDAGLDDAVADNRVDALINDARLRDAGLHTLLGAPELAGLWSLPLAFLPGSGRRRS